MWEVQDLFQNMLILVKFHDLIMNGPHMPLQQPSCCVCRAAVITCVFQCFSFKKVYASARIVVAWRLLVSTVVQYYSYSLHPSEEKRNVRCLVCDVVYSGGGEAYLA